MGLQKRHIPGNENLVHYYLCNYIPQSRGSDKLSKSLLAFKKGRYPHKQAWLDIAFSELSEHVELKDFLVLRALSSNEPPAAETPLDELGRRLAGSAKTRYDNSLLSKTREVPRMKQLSKTEREKALLNVYQFNKHGEVPAGVLIVDDILTTGTTLKSIAKAITNALPTIPITLFTLAYTDYDEHPNQEVTLIGNAYAWEKSNGWTVAAEYPELYNPSLEALKSQIYNDSFSD